MVGTGFRAEAYIGLGSNLAQPVFQLKSAVRNLGQAPDIAVQVCSGFYQTAPVGPQDQPDFVNAVLHLHTRLAPYDLLQLCQSIGLAQGRQRSAEQWGLRTLDLDLLLYRELPMASDEQWLAMDGDVLRLPHPELEKRAFVVKPLLEIAPGLALRPGRKLADLLPMLAGQGIKRLRENIDY